MAVTSLRFFIVASIDNDVSADAPADVDVIMGDVVVSHGGIDSAVATDASLPGPVIVMGHTYSKY